MKKILVLALIFWATQLATANELEERLQTALTTLVQGQSLLTTGLAELATGYNEVNEGLSTLTTGFDSFKESWTAYVEAQGQVNRENHKRIVQLESQVGTLTWVSLGAGAVALVSLGVTAFVVIVR